MTIGELKNFLQFISDDKEIKNVQLVNMFEIIKLIGKCQSNISNIVDRLNKNETVMEFCRDNNIIYDLNEVNRTFNTMETIISMLAGK